MEMQKDISGMNDMALEMMDQHRLWDHVLEHGCTDPCYEDGVILQRIRGRIIHLRRKMGLLYPRKKKPPIYYRGLPPVVSETYIARSEDIRANAQRTLWILSNNREFLYLTAYFSQIPSDVQKKEKCIKSVIDQPKYLSAALEKDDLLMLRKFENPKSFLEDQKAAASRLRKICVNMDWVSATKKQ